MDVETAIKIITPCITATAVIVALFQERIKSLWNRTKLRVDLNPQVPYCVRCPVCFQLANEGRHVADAMVVRAKIENSGRVAAEDIEVFLAKLERQSNTREWIVEETFTPDNLMWSGEGRAVRRQIPPGESRFVDLFKVIDPAQRLAGSAEMPNNPNLANSPALSLCVLAPNHSKGHLHGPGKYRMTITVSAKNARQVWTREIELREPWTADYQSCLLSCVVVGTERSRALTT